MLHISRYLFDGSQIKLSTTDYDGMNIDTLGLKDIMADFEFYDKLDAMNEEVKDSDEKLHNQRSSTT